MTKSSMNFIGIFIIFISQGVAEWCPKDKEISDITSDHAGIWETSGNNIKECIWRIVFRTAVITELQISRPTLDKESIITHVLGTGQKLVTVHDRLQIYMKWNNQSVQIAAFPEVSTLSRKFLTDTFYFWYIPSNRSSLSYPDLNPFSNRKKRFHLEARFRVIAHKCSNTGKNSTSSEACQDICYWNGTRQEVCKATSDANFRTSIMPTINEVTSLSSVLETIPTHAKSIPDIPFSTSITNGNVSPNIQNTTQPHTTSGIKVSITLSVSTKLNLNTSGNHVNKNDIITNVYGLNSGATYVTNITTSTGHHAPSHSTHNSPLRTTLQYSAYNNTTPLRMSTIVSYNTPTVVTKDASIRTNIWRSTKGDMTDFLSKDTYLVYTKKITTDGYRSYDNTKTTDSYRSYDNIKTTDSYRSYDNTKTTDGYRSYDNTKTTDGYRSYDNIKTTDGYRSYDNTKTTDGYRSYDNTKTTDDYRSYDNTKTTDSYRSYDNIKTTNGYRSYGDTKTTDGYRSHDNTKTTDNYRSYDNTKTTDNYRSYDNKMTSNTHSLYNKKMTSYSYSSNDNKVITDMASTHVVNFTVALLLSTKRSTFSKTATTNAPHVTNDDTRQKTDTLQSFHIVIGILGFLLLFLFMALILLGFKFNKIKSTIQDSSKSYITGDAHYLWRKNWIVNRKLNDFDGALANTSLTNHQTHSKGSQKQKMTLLETLSSSYQRDDDIYDNIAVVTSEKLNVKCVGEREPENTSSFQHNISSMSMALDKDRNFSSVQHATEYSKIDRQKQKSKDKQIITNHEKVTSL